MKRHIPYLMAAAVILLGSCMTREYDDDAPRIELTVSAEAALTKTTVAGEDAYNENTLSSLAVYLWAEGAEDSDALFCAEGIGVSNGLAKCYVPADVLSAIGSAGGSATAAVIGNSGYPALGGTATTLDDILEGTLSCDFSDGAVPSAFPMYGTGTLVLQTGGRVLSGSVKMRRSVARIDVRITELAAAVNDDSQNYIPDSDHMYIVLHNGLLRGPAGGYAHIAGNPSSQDYFTLSRGPLQAVGDGQGNTIYHTTSLPFWSFASNWSANESAAVSFLLIVPWSSDGGSTWRSSYYQIPVNASGFRIEDNVRYVINMNIGIVGSFEEQQPVTLVPSVVIQEWGAMDMDEVSMNESRYLVVGSEDVTLDNIEETTIIYASSHDCIISSATLTHEDLSSVNSDPITVPASEYTLELQSTGGTDRIYFRHELDNSGGAAADFAPYTLSFVIRHADNANYSQAVTITQQPMIYVVSDMNSDGTGSAHNGYTYVNNGSKSSYGSGCNGLTGSNKNPSMYVISLSAFGEGSEYTIGDPRLSYIDNLPTTSGTSLSYTWIQSATDINGNTRKMSYYHPTEGGARTKYMISPKFRIASSYGACQSASYNNLQRRCATYQEDGFPAGRWRIPTYAEIDYIISLSQQGTIPELFTIGTNDSNGYWCAHGWVGGDAQGKPTLHENDFSSNEYVRCVYDEWFWGSDRIQNRSTFTWGDIDY